MNMCSFNITKRLKLEVLIICNLLTFRSVRVFVSYDKYATLTQITFDSSCLCIPSILSWLIPQESLSCLYTPDSGVSTLDTKLFQSLLHFRVMANCYDDLRPSNIRSFNNISLTKVLLKMFSRVKHVIIWLKISLFSSKLLDFSLSLYSLFCSFHKHLFYVRAPNIHDHTSKGVIAFTYLEVKLDQYLRERLKIQVIITD